MRRIWVGIGSLMALVGTTAATTPGFKAGEWEITRAGGRDGTTTVKQCFTAADLAKDAAAPLAVKTKGGPKCSNSDMQMSNGSVTYKSKCKAMLGTMKSTWSGTYSPETFSVTGSMSAMGRSMTVTQNGRYLGACKS